MYVKIYVPTKSDTYLRAIAKRVSKLFGGCTVIPNCRGYWIKDGNTGYFVRTGKKQLIEDEISIVEAYTEDSFLDQGANYTSLMEILVKIKRDLKQEAVAYCTDNQIHFI